MERRMGLRNTNSKTRFLKSGDREHKLCILRVDLLLPAILCLSHQKSKVFFISRAMTQEKIWRKREAKGGRQGGWWGKKKGRKRRRKGGNSTRAEYFHQALRGNLHPFMDWSNDCFNSCGSNIPRLQYRPKMKLPFFRMFSLPLPNFITSKWKLNSLRNEKQIKSRSIGGLSTRVHQMNRTNAWFKLVRTGEHSTLACTLWKEHIKHSLLEVQEREQVSGGCVLSATSLLA